MRQAVAAVVLAGGASRRMGQEKALLTLPDGHSALTHVLRAAQTLANPILIAVDTADHAARLGLALDHGTDTPRLLLDRDPGAGPLAALAGAMRAVEAPVIIALAVDTPLVRPGLLQMLYERMCTEQDVPPDAIVPVVEGIPQPLPAVYGTHLAGAAEAAIAQGRRSLRALLEDPAVHVRPLHDAMLRHVDPDLRSFAGANTPDEWRRLLARAAMAAE